MNGLGTIDMLGDTLTSQSETITPNIYNGRIVHLPVALLMPGESPRLNGTSEAHVQLLAEAEAALPPIIVYRRTMRVIDGMHRLAAAVRCNRPTIAAELFDGSEADAYLRGVEANIAHGFPLSLSDRQAAAARIIELHPEMSDRAIAQSAGLGAKTVASIRRRSTGSAPQLNTRVGLDGRVRPVNGAEGRLRVAELIAQQPNASLRDLARDAGVSPATVSDVRKRLSRGQDPVRDGYRGRTAPRTRHTPAAVEVDPNAVLRKLSRDPSLRHNEECRQLLHLLQLNGVGATELPALATAVPSHCSHLIVQLAQHYARLWSGFAQALNQMPIVEADSPL